MRKIVSLVLIGALSAAQQGEAIAAALRLGPLVHGRQPEIVRFQFSMPGGRPAAAPWANARTLETFLSFPAAVLSVRAEEASSASPAPAAAAEALPLSAGQAPTAAESLRSASAWVLTMERAPRTGEQSAVDGGELERRMAGGAGASAASDYALRLPEEPLDEDGRRAIRRELGRLLRQRKSRIMEPGSSAYRRADPSGALAAHGVELHEVESAELSDAAAALKVAAYGWEQEGVKRVFLFSGVLPEFQTARERRSLAEHVRASWLKSSAVAPARPRWPRWNPWRVAEQWRDQARTAWRHAFGRSAFELFLYPLRGRISIQTAISLATAVLVPATTWLMKDVIDVAVARAANASAALLTSYVAATFVLKTVSSGLEFVRDWNRYSLGAGSVFEFFRNIFPRLSRMSLIEILRHNPRQLAVQLCNNAVYLPTAAFEFKTRWGPHLLQGSLCAALLLATDWRLALLGFAAFPIFLSLGAIFGKLYARNNLRYNARYNELIALCGQLLEQLAVFKIYGGERKMAEMLVASARAVKDVAEARAKMYAAYRFFVSSIGEWIALGIGLVCALRLFWTGAPSPGSIAAVQGYAFSMRYAIEGYMNDLMSVVEADGPLKPLEDALKIPVENDSLARVYLPPLQGKIDVRDLTFAYGPDKPLALKGVSFSVEPGQVVAFVGDNGSGKTTLVNLLAGSLKPASGRIFLDGHDAADVEVESQRLQQAVIPQKPLAFGTIRQILAMINPTATAEEMASALEEVGARFLRGKPEGLDTEMAELSGGQQQLVGVAMAVLRRPRLLFIDEGTANVDPAAAAAVQRLLWNRDGKTVIAVSHRPETLRKADRIFFLQDGRIVESGTYDELIALKGRFYTFEQASR